MLRILVVCFVGAFVGCSDSYELDEPFGVSSLAVRVDAGVAAPWPDDAGRLLESSSGSPFDSSLLNIDLGHFSAEHFAHSPGVLDSNHAAFRAFDCQFPDGSWIDSLLAELSDVAGPVAPPVAVAPPVSRASGPSPLGARVPSLQVARAVSGIRTIIDRSEELVRSRDLMGGARTRIYREVLSLSAGVLASNGTPDEMAQQISAALRSNVYFLEMRSGTARAVVNSELSLENTQRLAARRIELESLIARLLGGNVAELP